MWSGTRYPFRRFCSMLTDVICRAIRARKSIVLVYKGAKRTADPHILGFDDAGRMLLSAVQTSGGSGAGFRTYHVGSLSHVAETEHRFSPSKDYNPSDPLFERIICQV